MQTITLLDSTLRDGAQGEGLSFSLQDKIKITKVLDAFGIDYIEAGTPSSNQKDLEFFHLIKKTHLHQATLCAFGSTRRSDRTVETDEGLNLLIQADTPAVTIVGKASLSHVRHILKVTPEENLQMISDTLTYLKRLGKEIFFEAEHFFDGFQENETYALQVLQIAKQAGASTLVLCDTNGGTPPSILSRAISQVRCLITDIAFGIHCHNDNGCAVANSMLAVEAGVSHIQGTFLGFGERCGNADLCVLIPNLLLKKQCISHISHLEQLSDVASHIAEIANVSIPGNKPYVGHSAFVHKGGMHIDGMLKMGGAFEHISPEQVGNHRRYLLSEVAGRSTLVEKVKHYAPCLTKDSPETAQIIEKLKELEYGGYQFEGADASLELLVRKTLGWHRPHFELVLYKTIGEYPAPNGHEQASAMIEIKVGNNVEVSAALGNGPVNALDQALRKALRVFYPELDKVVLTDYKVRVLDTESATAAKVRVLIDSSDGTRSWTTVGVSTDIIEASWIALADSIEYQLISR